MLSRKFASKIDVAEAEARQRSEQSTSVALDRLKRLSSRTTAAAGETAASRPAEGRRAPRKSSVIGGTITASSMVAERPCKIVDMSATGAKIRLMPTSDQSRGLPAGVPDQFTLVLRVDRIEVDCEVAWRKDRELGVKFRGVPRPLAKGR
jgi:hypothetical protein